MYTELSIFFLCIETLLIALLVYLLFWKKAIVDKKSLIYAVPVFVVVYALYLMATAYNGEKIDFYTCFTLVKKVLELFAMKVEVALVRPLSEANGWYFVAVAIACILTLGTSVFGILVLFGATVSNAYKKWKNFMAGGDIVVGVSPNSLAYLGAHKNAVLWVESIEKAKYTDLLKQGYIVHKAKLNAKNVNKYLKGKEHHLIIFRDAKYSYFRALSCFEALKSDKDKRLFLHIEANVNEVKLVREKYITTMSKDTNSFIVPFCHYELMARRFVTEHPITKYIPRAFFNDNLTLKTEKEINVVFLGFGKVNYELFKMMVTNFQFAKEKDGKLTAAPVHYYAFEKNAERFNNEYFIRLREEYDQLFQDSDLPPAEKICDLKDVLPMDVHSLEARNAMRALVNADTYTYFILSVADDFEDAGFAYELKDSLGETGNYKIFVRSKGADGRLLNDSKDSIIYFGEDARSFVHENIVNDDLMTLSQHVNDLYNDHTSDKLAQLKAWQELPTVEQYSNINAATHIYYKLNLMGFELKKAKDGGLTKEEFSAACPDAFMHEKGKDYEYFFGLTTANVLAFIEHSRWNAYYILAGYKPLPFKDFWWKTNKHGIDVLQHKNTAKHLHACLTTYADLHGLLEYKYETIKAAAESGEKKVGEVSFDALADIYRYDYMVIDGMYDALNELGYSIVKK